MFWLSGPLTRAIILPWSLAMSWPCSTECSSLVNLVLKSLPSLELLTEADIENVFIARWLLNDLSIHFSTSMWGLIIPARPVYLMVYARTQSLFKWIRSLVLV